MHVLIKVETKSQQKTRFYNSKVSDLIQIACHYNDDTLLTKNADLIQIIQVQGFINKNADQQERILRDDIRTVILKYIKDPDIAVHIHIIRDYKNIMPNAYSGPKDKYMWKVHPDTLKTGVEHKAYFYGTDNLDIAQNNAVDFFTQQSTALEFQEF